MTERPTEITEALRKPFPPSAIKQRRGGGGKMLDYLEGHAVINRLIAATDNNFDFDVRNVEFLTDDTIIAVVSLTIEGLGTRTHMGVQRVHGGGGEDMLKGVVTDGLKKAATLFGVGLDLYGTDYEAPPSPKAILRQALNASGVKSKADANTRAQEHFQVDLDALNNEQMVELAQKLTEQQPAPF